MTVPLQQKVSSIEALASSIETDSQVCRWFTLLVVQPNVKNHLIDKENNSEFYESLKKSSFIQRILFGFIFLLIIYSFYTHQYQLLWAGLVFIYPCIKMHQTSKNSVKEISVFLMKNDFKDEELCQKTLYQIAEIYSRKYDIPSLVDTIFALDNISRKTLIFVFVFTAWIYPLKLWQIFAATIASYFIIQIIIKTSFVYKHLK